MCCTLCGAAIDAAMFDGHRESCRLAQRQRQATLDRQRAEREEHLREAQRQQDMLRFNLQQQQRREYEDARRAKESNAASGISTTSTSPTTPSDMDDMFCVVCWEDRRQFAFLPCGHVAACAKCAPRLDACPVCRKQKTGLVRTDISDASCVCKRCGHVIAPALFDAHREVCALLRRMQWATESPRPEGSATDATASATAVTPPPPPSPPKGAEAPREEQLCANCHQRNRDRCFVPCGHFLFCAACAAVTQTCPLCVTPISDRVALFRP